MRDIQKEIRENLDAIEKKGSVTKRMGSMA